jgi:hypothetical protein
MYCMYMCYAYACTRRYWVNYAIILIGLISTLLSMISVAKGVGALCHALRCDALRAHANPLLPPPARYAAAAAAHATSSDTRAGCAACRDGVLLRRRSGVAPRHPRGQRGEVRVARAQPAAPAARGRRAAAVREYRHAQGGK